MKKIHLTLMLSLTAMVATAVQSFALVPPPESLKTSKHKEQARPVDPNTTVIVSKGFTFYLPTNPASAGLAYYLPTNPASARLAFYLPTNPAPAGLAFYLPTNPASAGLAFYLPTNPAPAG
jgi:hypothetical protein